MLAPRFTEFALQNLFFRKSTPAATYRTSVTGMRDDAMRTMTLYQRIHRDQSSASIDGRGLV